MYIRIIKVRHVPLAFIVERNMVPVAKQILDPVIQLGNYDQRFKNPTSSIGVPREKPLK